MEVNEDRILFLVERDTNGMEHEVEALVRLKKMDLLAASMMVAYRRGLQRGIIMAMEVDTLVSDPSTYTATKLIRDGYEVWQCGNCYGVSKTRREAEQCCESKQGIE